jgi:hypothetical protein
MVEPEFRQQVFQFFLLLLPGEIGHLKNGADIVFHGKLSEHGCFLGEITDAHLGPLVHRQAGNFLLAKEYGSFIRPDETNNHVKRGGFPGAVGTKQTHNLALLYVHGHFVYNGSVPVLLNKVLGMDDQAHEYWLMEPAAGSGRMDKNKEVLPEKPGRSMV